MQTTSPKGADNDPHAEMLARVARGDTAAARSLARDLGTRAFHQAHRMLGDRAEAEDVAQDAMMRLLRAAPNWQTGQARVTTWLYRVVANLCLDRMRRTKRMTALDPDMALVDPSPGVEAKLQDQARRRALYDALGQLPDRQRQAVTLRHIEGLGNPEIADIMEIGVEAVESLTARGRRKLAVLLQNRQAELGIDHDQA